MVYLDLRGHLVADTQTELHAFALRMGLRRHWFHNKRGRRHPHYDLTTARKRRQAILAGAVLVSARQVVEKARQLSGKRMMIYAGAEFSADKIYRYALYRIWDNHKPKIMFVGLNPSTADESVDDPTIRRCVRYAADWGYGKMVMTNLFAFRATAPKVMMAHRAPICPEGEPRQNDIWLQRLAQGADLIIAAWGNHGGHMNRDLTVLPFLPNVMCLGLTNRGKPKHPLYLRLTTQPQKMRFRTVQY